ncbi:MAG: hypothetical protein EXS38_12345 [Opitutus sp.]|nr:hypothetical protein [Opitutus sp.]
MKIARSLTLLSLVALASAVAAEAPVPVVKEPRHQTTFENEYLRVIDVKIPVGDVTLYHVHDLPSVVVYLAKATNRTVTFGETTPASRSVSPGESRYVPYDEKPLTHQVTNPGPALFHVLDIELLKPAPSGTSAPGAAPAGAKLSWEEKRVRTYNVNLDSGANSAFPSNAFAHLVIGIGGTVKATTAKGATRQLANGEFAFLPPQTRVQFSNAGKEKAEVVVLELK